MTIRDKLHLLNFSGENKNKIVALSLLYAKHSGCDKDEETGFAGVGEKDRLKGKWVQLNIKPIKGGWMKQNTFLVISNA